MPTDEMVEKVARAIDPSAFSYTADVDGSLASILRRDQAMKAAERAIAALAAAEAGEPVASDAAWLEIAGRSVEKVKDHADGRATYRLSATVTAPESASVEAIAGQGFALVFEENKAVAKALLLAKELAESCVREAYIDLEPDCLVCETLAAVEYAIRATVDKAE